MDRLVHMFHGGIVKENGEFENMNEVVELFDARPSFKDLVDRAMRKYGCGVDEMTLRGRFDCGKARPHYVLMNLASESNWKQYEEVIEHANVVCLEVWEEAKIDDDEISLGFKDDDFQEEDGAQDVQANAHEDIVVGDGLECEEEESQSEEDGPESEEEESQSEEDGPQVNTTTVHDVEDIGCVDKCVDYTLNVLQLLKECYVKLPSIPSSKDISMVHKAICQSTC
uniref:Transposase MuDR plant domain-containing protein n=1 Tax=Setaria italica TaxID=4555 RepID=K3XRJ7_SETIT